MSSLGKDCFTQNLQANTITCNKITANNLHPTDVHNINGDVTIAGRLLVNEKTDGDNFGRVSINGGAQTIDITNNNLNELIIQREDLPLAPKFLGSFFETQTSLPAALHIREQDHFELVTGATVGTGTRTQSRYYPIIINGVTYNMLLAPA